MFGVDCASGDTFTDGSVRYAMSSIRVPDPVMSLAIVPKSNQQSAAFSKALQRFQKEDPTFKVGLNTETGETIVSGMGELHLDVYIERMRREYKYLVKDLRSPSLEAAAMFVHQGSSAMLESQR